MVPAGFARARSDHRTSGTTTTIATRLRDALRPIAARHGVSVSAVAVAWTLSWRGVTGAIVGARSAAQVDGWIAAGQFDLSPADLDEIARAIEQTEAGEGPARPEQAAARPKD